MMTHIGTCQVTDGCTNPIENLDLGCCASCGAIMRKMERQAIKDAGKRQQALSRSRQFKQVKPISKVSKKQTVENALYAVESKGWLKGKQCAVDPRFPATQIHHMRGRSINTYADEEARQKGINLLRDKRFWLPVSDEGHERITRDSAWAVEQGYSIPRLP